MRTIQDGDNLFGADWMNLIQSQQREMIRSGCGMTVGGALDVDIAPGNALFRNTEVVVGVINLVHDAEAVFDNRYDLITVDNAGVASITKGLAENIAPDIPAGEILIGVVRIRKDIAVLIASDLNDARIIVDFRLLAEGSAVLLAGAGNTTDVNVTDLGPITVGARNTGVVVGEEFDWIIRKNLAFATSQTVRFRRIDAGLGNLAFDYTIKVL